MIPQTYENNMRPRTQSMFSTVFAYNWVFLFGVPFAVGPTIDSINLCPAKWRRPSTASIYARLVCMHWAYNAPTHRVSLIVDCFLVWLCVFVLVNRSSADGTTIICTSSRGSSLIFEYVLTMLAGREHTARIRFGWTRKSYSSKELQKFKHPTNFSTLELLYGSGIRN